MPRDGSPRGMSQAPFRMKAPPIKDGHGSVSARLHRRARRPAEQPEACQRHHPQVPGDCLRGAVGLGQVVAGVRHDRRVVTAGAQRDLPQLHPAVPAEVRPAPCGCHRPPAGGHRHRATTHAHLGALHAGHLHRHLLAVAAAVQPRRQALRRLLRHLLVQPATGHVPALPGPGICRRHRRVEAHRSRQVTQPGRHHLRQLRPQHLAVEALRQQRLVRQRQAGARLHARRIRHPDECAAPPPHRCPGGLAEVGALRGGDPAHPSLDHRQEGGGAPPRGPGRHRHASALPGLRRHAAASRCAHQPDQPAQHRRCVADGPGARPRLPRFGHRAAGGRGGAPAAHQGAIAHRHRPGLSDARPHHQHPVGRRDPTHQDRQVPHQRARRPGVHPRRAQRRPAPARHRPDQQGAAQAEGARQHRADRGAQPRGDRDGRPCDRDRPRGRQRRWHRHLHRQLRRADGVRHPHRTHAAPAPALPRAAAGHREPGAAPCGPAQPARRLGGRAAGRRDGDLGCGRGRQELADRGPARATARRLRRPAPERHHREHPFDAGHLPRGARRDPQAVRGGEPRGHVVVQLQRAGRLPTLQGQGRHHHQHGLHGSGGAGMRAVPRPALQRPGTGLPVPRQEHRRGAHHGHQRRTGVLRAGARGARQARQCGAGGPGLSDARPVDDHPVRRRTATPQARR